MSGGTQTLIPLIEMMREHGVISLKTGDVEIVLGAQPRVEFRVPDIDKPAESVEAARGSDGLTAVEQEELYGRVIDAKG